MKSLPTVARDEIREVIDWLDYDVWEGFEDLEAAVKQLKNAYHQIIVKEHREKQAAQLATKSS